MPKVTNIRRNAVLWSLLIVGVAAGGGWAAWAHRDFDEALLRRTGPLNAAEWQSVLRIGAAHADPKLRGEACALLKAGNEDALRPVLEQAWDGGEQEQADLARTVYCDRWPEDGVRRLAKDIRAASPEKKAQYLAIVGGIVSPTSATVLREHLLDPEPVVRNAVCNVLRTYDPKPDGKTVAGRFHEYAPVFADALRKMRETDPNRGVRTHSNCALQILTDDRYPDNFREPTFHLDAK